MNTETKRTAPNRHARRPAAALGGNEIIADVGTAVPIPDAIIREPECRRRTGLSRSTRWRLERRGKFPRRRQLSPGCSGWLASEIAAWISARRTMSRQITAGAPAHATKTKDNITHPLFSSSAAGEQAAAVRSTQRRAQRRTRPTDFAAVNRAALAILPTLLERWLPGGRTEGAEYVVLNPRRSDQHLGSFRVNLRTGRWADFAVTGVRGGDPVSLAAHLLHNRIWRDDCMLSHD
jgi:predicted DNA-binding transcriptional regulator AlpA